jgi:hypothetical protein
MRSPGWKTRASSSTSPSRTSGQLARPEQHLELFLIKQLVSSAAPPRLATGSRLVDSLVASESLLAQLARLSGKHDLELFLTTRAAHRRGIRRVRWDVEMLARDEARTDVLTAERTRDLVMGERASIDRDPTTLIDLLHATSLGACYRNPRRAERRSRARRRRSRSATRHLILPCALTTDARSSFQRSVGSASFSRSSRSRFPIPEAARLPR